MQKEFESIHPLIGFSHVIPKTTELLSKIDTTKNGPLFIGSPLSFHLSALEFNFTVVTNLEAAVNLAQADPSDIYKVNLPYQFPGLPEAVHFNTAQENFIEHLRVTHQESTDIEKRTVKQRECDEWIKRCKKSLDQQCVTESMQEKVVSIILPKNLTSPLSL